jgi:hypothetical protein
VLRGLDGEEIEVTVTESESSGGDDSGSDGDGSGAVGGADGDGQRGLKGYYAAFAAKQAAETDAAGGADSAGKKVGRPATASRRAPPPPGTGTSSFAAPSALLQPARRARRRGGEAFALGDPSLPEAERRRRRGMGWECPPHMSALARNGGVSFRRQQPDGSWAVDTGAAERYTPHLPATAAAAAAAGVGSLAQARSPRCPPRWEGCAVPSLHVAVISPLPLVGHERAGYGGPAAATTTAAAAAAATAAAPSGPVRSPAGAAAAPASGASTAVGAVDTLTGAPLTDGAAAADDGEQGGWTRGWDVLPLSLAASPDGALLLATAPLTHTVYRLPFVPALSMQPVEARAELAPWLTRPLRFATIVPSFAASDALVATADPATRVATVTDYLTGSPVAVQQLPYTPLALALHPAAQTLCVAGPRALVRYRLAAAPTAAPNGVATGSIRALRGHASSHGGTNSGGGGGGGGGGVNGTGGSEGAQSRGAHGGSDADSAYTAVARGSGSAGVFRRVASLSLSNVTALKYSHSGHMLAAAAGRRLWVLASDSLQTLWALGPTPELVTALAWSPDDAMLTAVGAAGMVAKWLFRPGGGVDLLELHSGDGDVGYSSAAVDAHGRVAVAGCGRPLISAHGALVLRWGPTAALPAAGRLAAAAAAGSAAAVPTPDEAEAAALSGCGASAAAAFGPFSGNVPLAPGSAGAEPGPEPDGSASTTAVSAVAVAAGPVNDKLSMHKGQAALSASGMAVLRHAARVAGVPVPGAGGDAADAAGASADGTAGTGTGGNSEGSLGGVAAGTSADGRRGSFSGHEALTSGSSSSGGGGLSNDSEAAEAALGYLGASAQPVEWMASHSRVLTKRAPAAALSRIDVSTLPTVALPGTSSALRTAAALARTSRSVVIAYRAGLYLQPAFAAAAPGGAAGGGSAHAAAGATAAAAAVAVGGAPDRHRGSTRRRSSAAAPFAAAAASAATATAAAVASTAHAPVAGGAPSGGVHASAGAASAASPLSWNLPAMPAALSPPAAAAGLALLPPVTRRLLQYAPSLKLAFTRVGAVDLLLGGSPQGDVLVFPWPAGLAGDAAPVLTVPLLGCAVAGLHASARTGVVVAVGVDGSIGVLAPALLLTALHRSVLAPFASTARPGSSSWLPTLVPGPVMRTLAVHSRPRAHALLRRISPLFPPHARALAALAHAPLSALPPEPLAALQLFLLAAPPVHAPLFPILPPALVRMLATVGFPALLYAGSHAGSSAGYTIGGPAAGALAAALEPDMGGSGSGGLFAASRPLSAVVLPWLAAQRSAYLAAHGVVTWAPGAGAGMAEPATEPAFEAQLAAAAESATLLRTGALPASLAAAAAAVSAGESASSTAAAVAAGAAPHFTSGGVGARLITPPARAADGSLLLFPGSLSGLRFAGETAALAGAAAGAGTGLAPGPGPAHGAAAALALGTATRVEIAAEAAHARALRRQLRAALSEWGQHSQGRTQALALPAASALVQPQASSAQVSAATTPAHPAFVSPDEAMLGPDAALLQPHDLQSKMEELERRCAAWLAQQQAALTETVAAQEGLYERRLAAEAARAREVSLVAGAEIARLQRELTAARSSGAAREAALAAALDDAAAGEKAREAELTLELGRQRTRLAALLNEEVEMYDNAIDEHERQVQAAIEATAQRSRDLKQANAVLRGRIGEQQRRIGDLGDRVHELEAARTDDAAAAAELQRKGDVAHALVLAARAAGAAKDDKLAKLSQQVDVLQRNRFVSFSLGFPPTM